METLRIFWGQVCLDWGVGAFREIYVFYSRGMGMLRGVICFDGSCGYVLISGMSL